MYVCTPIRCAFDLPIILLTPSFILTCSQTSVLRNQQQTTTLTSHIFLVCHVWYINGIPRDRGEAQASKYRESACVCGLCAWQTVRHLSLVQCIGLKRELFRLSVGGFCLTQVKSDETTVRGCVWFVDVLAAGCWVAAASETRADVGQHSDFAMLPFFYNRQSL